MASRTVCVGEQERQDPGPTVHGPERGGGLRGGLRGEPEADGGALELGAIGPPSAALHRTAATVAARSDLLDDVWLL